MPDTPNNQPAESNTTGGASPSIALPSTLRYDLLIITMTAFAGLLGGIVITLAYLGLGTSDLLVLLGILIAFGAISVFYVRARARRLQQTALSEWARAARAEHAAQSALVSEQTQQLANQRAQIETFETNLALAELHDAATGIPVIRGWQTFGMPEEEIAPQMQMLAALFRGQAEIHIQKKFSGGHRNRGVYQIRSSAEADRIVKIARSSDIRAERQAQEWINRFSQNNGAQYVRDVHSDDDAAPGGIVYRLPSLRRNAVLASLEMFYRETPNPTLCAQIVEQLYGETLPHSEFRHAETIALFREYALPEYVLQRIENALPFIPALAHVTRGDASVRILFGNRSYRARNPLYWAINVLPQYYDTQFAVMCGVIHGDLHSGNVLVEMSGQPLWLIDFAKTRADAPTLSDYARMEADLKFYLVPDGAGEQLSLLQIEEQLLAPRVTSELEPMPELFQPYGEEIQKAGGCIAALRRVAVNHRADAHPHGNGHFVGNSVLPYYLALWHTTMRSLYYTQCSAAQKTYAFLSAGMLSERIIQLRR